MTARPCAMGGGMSAHRRRPGISIMVTVAVGGGDLQLGTELSTMREADVTAGAAALRSALAQDGYLLFRDLLPREAVLAGLNHIVLRLSRNDWVAPPSDGVGDDSGGGRAPALGDMEPPSLLYLHESEAGGQSAGYGTVEQQAKLLPLPQASVPVFRGCVDKAGPASFIRDPAIARIVEGPELDELFCGLLSTPAVSTLDFKWLRMLSPGPTTNFHLDHCFFHENYRRDQPLRQAEADATGMPSMLTAWIPWCDMDIEETGGLAILRGSNHLPGFQRVRETYGAIDVSHTDVVDAAHFTSDPHELLAMDAGAVELATLALLCSCS